MEANISRGSLGHPGDSNFEVTLDGSVVIERCGKQWK